MTDLNRDEAKKSKWPTHKKLGFSTLPILNIFLRKFQGLVLGLGGKYLFFVSSRSVKMRGFSFLSLFELAILIFLLHPYSNQSQFIEYQGWDEILMITLISSKKLGVCNNNNVIII